MRYISSDRKYDVSEFLSTFKEVCLTIVIIIPARKQLGRLNLWMITITSNGLEPLLPTLTATEIKTSLFSSEAK